VAGRTPHPCQRRFLRSQKGGAQHQPGPGRTGEPSPHPGSGANRRAPPPPGSGANRRAWPGPVARRVATGCLFKSSFTLAGFKTAAAETTDARCNGGDGERIPAQSPLCQIAGVIRLTRTCSNSSGVVPLQPGLRRQSDRAPGSATTRARGPGSRGAVPGARAVTFPQSPRATSLSPRYIRVTSRRHPGARRSALGPAHARARATS
jgi:hypothetical protein